MIADHVSMNAIGNCPHLPLDSMLLLHATFWLLLVVSSLAAYSEKFGTLSAQPGQNKGVANRTATLRQRIRKIISSYSPRVVATPE